MKIGFLGVGNMGSAVAKAVAKSGDHELLFDNYNEAKAKHLQNQIGGQVMDKQTIVDEADVIFLGVKPHLVNAVLEDVKNDQALWISMAAGVSIDQLSDFVPLENIVRMMPNTPVAIGHGMITYATENNHHAELFETLLTEAGIVMRLPEAKIDSATAIAGSGPGYVYTFIESLTDAGIQNGLSFEESKLLAAQTLLGASEMVLQMNEHPAELRHQVTSPGGSTINGLVSLEQNNFRYATIEAVNETLKRTRELGDN